MMLAKRVAITSVILQIFCAISLYCQQPGADHRGGNGTDILIRMQAASAGFQPGRYSILIGISASECQGCAIPALNAIMGQARRIVPEPNMVLVVDSAAGNDFITSCDRIQTRNAIIDTTGRLFDALNIRRPPELVVLDPTGSIVARVADVQHTPFMLKDIFDTLPPASGSFWDHARMTELRAEESRLIGKPYSTAFDARRGQAYLLDPRTGLVTTIDITSGRVRRHTAPDDRIKYFYRRSANEPQWKVLEQIGADLAHTTGIALSSDGDTLFTLVSVHGRYFEGSPEVHNGKDTVYPVRWERRQLVAGYRGDSLVTVRPVPDSTIMLMNLIAPAQGILIGSCSPDVAAAPPQSLLMVGSAGMIFRLWGKERPGFTLRANDLRGAYPAVSIDSRSAGMLCTTGDDRVCYLDAYNGIFFLNDPSTDKVVPILPKGALIPAFTCAASIKTAGDPMMDCGILPTSLLAGTSRIYVALTSVHSGKQIPVLQIYDRNGTFIGEHEIIFGKGAITFASIIAATADTVYLLVQRDGGTYEVVAVKE